MENDEVIIRALYESDFECLNEIRKSKGVSEYILSLDDETLSQTISYFTDKQYNKHNYIAEKLCEGRNVVVGYLRLCLDEDIRKRHKGKISIAIANEYH